MLSQHMSQKHYGVVRVMNTLGAGAVTGLEAGSAVMSYEATAIAQQYFPDCIIAVTNHHVVGAQPRVMLNFHWNATPFPASVFKVSPQNDLALLHIDTRAPEFVLANEGKHIDLVRGSDNFTPTRNRDLTKVLAVGFPLGTAHQTISKGYITAIETMENNVVFYHDCLINPGNSGGALLHEGRLIGINTAIMNPGTTVSIAKPYETVLSLFNYIKPEIQHPDMPPEAFRQLLGMYHVHAEPDELFQRWSDVKCDCGGKNRHPPKFSDWFNEHAKDRQDAHALVQTVLSHLAESPEKIDELCAAGWAVEPTRAQPSIMRPEQIVFNEHFDVTPTHAFYDSLLEKYNALGVVITNVQPHENLTEGELLVGVDGRQLDTFGNFKDNGMPYFTAFKTRPDTEVTLLIANEEGKREVKYTYTRLTELPLIHSQGLTPFERAQMVKIGGVIVTQMNAEMAKQHPQYLKPPMNNKVVGMVVQVDPLCPEWNVQRIAPGFLLTRVNGAELEGSLTEAVQDAKYVTFEGNGKLINKLC